jgi:hypothetical protein
VWLQDPGKAAKYKAAGINVYIALWEGPTEKQLAALKKAGMPLICEQNAVALKHLDDPTIVGWLQPDEPDNAQEETDPKTGKKGYGPPVKPAKIVADYEKLRAADPTRPVLLGLGQGVTNEKWVGRGNEGRPEDYLTYVNGGDILSYDIYPMASPELGKDALHLVPQGVDRLRKWTGGKKPTWNCIECTNIGGKGKATPAEVKTEVWMSIIHGTKGIIYFVHQFSPKFDEHALLDDPEMLKAVTAINRQIRELAPVLNEPTVEDGMKVSSENASVPIDAMLKKHDSATYLFAVAMRDGSTKATFKLPGIKGGAKIEVIGENRKVAVQNGAFEDGFEGFGVHLYRIGE